MTALVGILTVALLGGLVAILVHEDAQATRLLDAAATLPRTIGRCRIRGQEMRDLDVLRVAASVRPRVAIAIAFHDARDPAPAERTQATGDPAFDEAVHVVGEQPQVAALLGASERKAVRALFALREEDGPKVLVRPWLAGSEAGADVDEAHLRDVDLHATASALAACADVLASAAVEDAWPRVERHGLGDPVAGVRAACMKLLRRSARPEAREALRRGLHDADGHVRLAAAIALDEEGRAVLLQLASDPRGPLAQRARATLALPEPPPGLVAELLPRVAGDPGMESQALGLVALLATHGGRDDVATLREVEAGARRRPDLLAATRGAIAAVRARLGEASGHLDLAGGEGGTLDEARSGGDLSEPPASGLREP